MRRKQNCEKQEEKEDIRLEESCSISFLDEDSSILYLTDIAWYHCNKTYQIIIKIITTDVRSVIKCQLLN